MRLDRNDEYSKAKITQVKNGFIFQRTFFSFETGNMVTEVMILKSKAELVQGINRLFEEVE